MAYFASLIGSAAMLLAWMGGRREDTRLIEAARLIETAIERVVAVPERRTRVRGGLLGTKASTFRSLQPSASGE